MLLGIFKGLFGKKDRTPEPSEFRGPLDLAPGDRVSYYQRELRVAGVVLLDEGGERHVQYHLRDLDGRSAVLLVSHLGDGALALQDPLEDDRDLAATSKDAKLKGVDHRLRREGEAAAWCVGDIPPEKTGRVKYWEYVDDDEVSSISVEKWGDAMESRSGPLVYESELEFHRQGAEEDWEVKAPPKIDMRSVTEARIAEEQARAARDARRRAKELDAAREKLASFDDGGAAPPAEGGTVSMSEIVGSEFRWADEIPAPEAPPDDPDPPADEAPAEEPRRSDEAPPALFGEDFALEAGVPEPDED